VGLAVFGRSGKISPSPGFDPWAVETAILLSFTAEWPQSEIFEGSRAWHDR